MEFRAGKCVISFDTHCDIPNKDKCELFSLPIQIRATNGSNTDNKSECDKTFRIYQEKFTLPFLVLKPSTHHFLLGYNFSKNFHIGTTWYRCDQVCQINIGKVIATL